MKKLFYIACLAGFLASCNNEAKNNEAKAADEAKINAAYEEMNAAEMQKVTEECNAAVTAAAQAKVDSINALPKAAQATAKKAAVKKPAVKKPATTTVPQNVNTGRKENADGSQSGTNTGRKEATPEGGQAGENLGRRRQ